MNRPSPHHGPKRCRICLGRLRPDEPATRLATVTGYSNPVGRLKYWLCRRCSDFVDEAVGKAAKVAS